MTASGVPALLISLAISAGLFETSWVFFEGVDPVDMEEMAESIDEFRGGAWTFSILNDPGVALTITFVGSPTGVFTGSETLLFSFGGWMGSEDLG